MEKIEGGNPVSIWIGVADENFEEYIDQDAYGENCGFCQDIGQAYDVDKFSVYVSEEMLNLDDLIIEIPFSESYENPLISKCKSMGIEKANAYISILDEAYEFKDNDKKFSGLHFIGVFYYELPDEWSENGIV